MEGEGTEPGMNHLQPPHPSVTHSPHVVHHSPRHPTRPHLTPYTRVVILPPLVTLVR